MAAQAGQQRVQHYLDRHRISALFEVGSPDDLNLMNYDRSLLCNILEAELGYSNHKKHFSSILNGHSQFLKDFVYPDICSRSCADVSEKGEEIVVIFQEILQKQDLMARLVQHTPAEPVPYLIKILQKFDEKAKKPFKENPLAPRTKPLTPTASKTPPKVRPKDPSARPKTPAKRDPLSRSSGQLSKSTSNLPKELREASTPSGKPASATSPGSAYTWHQSSAPRKTPRGPLTPQVSYEIKDKPLTGVYGEDRGYERPWIANMKKMRYEQSLLKARKLRKSTSTGGDEGSTPSSEADVELIFEGSEEKPPQRPKTLFNNPASQAWVSERDQGPYRPPPPKPYQPPDAVEEAFLAEELSADRLMKRYEKVVSPDAQQANERQKIEQRRAKPDQQAKKHKEQLAALVEQQRKVETLGYLDSGGETTEPDQGGYEEATDMLEDASDLMDEGVTNVKTTGQKTRRRPPPAVTQVKVGVCSRCAGVAGGGDGGTLSGMTKGYGAYTSIDSSSEVSLSSSSDFESASQVSGPRPMAWEGTTGDDGRSSKAAPARSMTHDQTSELFQSSAKVQWETRSYTSETEVEHRTSRVESLLEKGRSWPQPGSDDDSSV